MPDSLFWLPRHLLKYDNLGTLQGLIQSAFLWGYTATQLLGGHLADRFGGRAVIGFGVAWFSIASLLLPAALSPAVAAAGMTLPAVLLARMCVVSGAVVWRVVSGFLSFTAAAGDSYRAVTAAAAATAAAVQCLCSSIAAEARQMLAGAAAAVAMFASCYCVV
jgi:MFS family permease